ncbi:hypothetical protein PV341_31080 [Streptomyces sp. PA03-1a]|nr:hypothetical protein [Streptomyces sp. PA03-1a]MDX2813390.1 hypothetical protein [Streptomyces sp. PA03-5A]
MTATYTPQQRAARLARSFAEALRDRNALRASRPEPREIAALLDTAATVLEAAPPATDMPDAAAAALHEAGEIAEGTGDLPATALEYITATITGRMPELPHLNPTTPALARQAQDLQARITTVLHDAFDSDTDSSVRFVATALLALHRKFDRLTEDVATDRFQPTA